MENRYYLFPLLLLACLSQATAQSQWDTAFVKDYTSRILWSYFQEYKSISVQVSPRAQLDPEGTETLLLQSGNNLYSGALIQYKGIALYLAGSLPQSEADREQFGRQRSNVWKLNVQFPALGWRMHRVHYQGFYDMNFEQHAFAAIEDERPFERYQNMELTWFGTDVKHYPAYRRFAQGLPENFNLHQLRSKFALGYRAGYNHLRLNNQEKPLFGPSLQAQDSSFSLYRYAYTGSNLSVGPSFYLAGRSGLFLYADIWMGVDGGFYNAKGQNYQRRNFRVNLALPEMRVALGWQSRRYLIALYYLFQNQHFRTEPMQLSHTLHSFGFIIGFRSNSPARWAF